MIATEKLARVELAKIGAALDPADFAKGVYCIELPAGKAFAYNNAHVFWAGHRQRKSIADIWTDILFVAKRGLTDCDPKYCAICEEDEQEGNKVPDKMEKLKVYAEEIADDEQGEIEWFDGKNQSIGIDWENAVLYICDPNSPDGPTVEASSLDDLKRVYESEPNE